MRQLGVLLFMMTGPLRVVPVFAGVTRGMEGRERRAVAGKAVGIAAVAVTLAVYVGRVIMGSWGASAQAVAGASGLLLALASLEGILGKGGSGGAGGAEDGRGLAMEPLAFPVMVPPFAVGVLILFASFAKGAGELAMMAGMAVGMLVVDWVAMVNADGILRVFRPAVLRVLGSVFGVLQLSLGIEMMLYAVRAYGVGGG